MHRLNFLIVTAAVAAAPTLSGCKTPAPVSSEESALTSPLHWSFKIFYRLYEVSDGFDTFKNLKPSRYSNQISQSDREDHGNTRFTIANESNADPERADSETSRVVLTLSKLSGKLRANLSIFATPDFTLGFKFYIPRIEFSDPHQIGRISCEYGYSEDPRDCAIVSEFWTSENSPYAFMPGLFEKVHLTCILQFTGIPLPEAPDALLFPVKSGDSMARSAFSFSFECRDLSHDGTIAASGSFSQNVAQ